MADPEVPGAADNNTRLTAKFQSLHRGPALEALGLDQDSPPAELRSGTTAAADLDPKERALDLSEAMAMFSRPRADAASSPAPPPAALRPSTPIPDTDFRPTERMPAQGNGFVKDIDELLARGVDKVQVPPARLIEFLQDLPVPQGAKLQNLQMEILDNRSATAQGEISKARSTTHFTVTLETRPDGFLQVRTVNLKVAFLHRGAEKDIRDRLQNLILRLQSRLDSEIEDQYWQTAGFCIVDDPVYGREFAISFRRRQ